MVTQQFLSIYIAIVAQVTINCRRGLSTVVYNFRLKIKHLTQVWKYQNSFYWSLIKTVTKLSQEKQMFLRAVRLQWYSGYKLTFVNLKLCLCSTQLHYQLQDMLKLISICFHTYPNW